MSRENKLWMGNLEDWMDETKIMKFFNEYNFNPKSIQMIKDKRKGGYCKFCYVIFCNIYEANDALTKLDGKKILNTNSTFKLKWANPNSENIDIYVGNLSPEIDNLELYNLFKEKYPSVHHASIITSNNTSKGYGFINFLDKEESKKSIKEMDGYIFYNKALKVKEKINNDRDKKDKKDKKDNNNEKKSEDEIEIKEIENIIENENNEYFSNDIKFIGILKGHNGPVTSLVFLEDEKGVPILFSGSEDTTIIKWKLLLEDNKFEGNNYSYQKKELKLAKIKNIIREHNNFITSLSLSSDKTKLISSSLDKTIIVWNINNLNKDLIIKESLESEVLAACFTPDDKIILSGEKNRKLKFFDRKGDPQYIDKNLNAYITCFLKIIKGKQNYFAIGLSDGKVRIYNDEYYRINTIQEYNKIINNKDNIQKNNEEQYSGVSSLAIEDDGDFLFIGYRNGIFMILDLEHIDDYNYEYKEEDIKYIIRNPYEINNILYESKFFEFVFIGDNKGFKLRKIKGDIIYEDNSAACLSLCIDNNRNYLFAGFADGNIRVYHLLTDN